MTWTCSNCGHPNLMNERRCRKCSRPRDNYFRIIPVMEKIAQ